MKYNTKMITTLLLFMLTQLVHGQSEVKIEEQIWMKTNLDIDKFRNGDPIQEAKTQEEWLRAAKNEQPAWCYYNNDSKNGKNNGKLYNWYAVADPRGLAPSGWHIPTDEEWYVLEDNLMTDEEADNDEDEKDRKLNQVGIRMMKKGLWRITGSTDEMNKSGFMAYPSGVRPNDGFASFGTACAWWGAAKFTSMSPSFYKDVDKSPTWLFFALTENEQYLRKGNCAKDCGLSVRCIKD